MQSFPALRAGTLALACVLAPVTHAVAADLLTGIPRLACEATLCLSSGNGVTPLPPSGCSLTRQGSKQTYNRHRY
jgi:hypothetical protein